MSALLVWPKYGVAENRYDNQRLNFYTLPSTVVSEFYIKLCISLISNAENI